MDAKKEQEIRAEVADQFRRMDAQVVDVCPGLNDLLEVYGRHDAAARLAEAYFKALSPTPKFTTSDGSM